MDQLNVSIAEAAKMIGVQTSKMLEMVEKGVIPAWRDGRNWKIPIESLREWNKARAVREAAERRKAYGAV